MALTKAKQELVTKKNESGLDYTINKMDVVGLVRQAWKSSFARKQTNIKAISTRGWGPRALNYNALPYPEVLTLKPGYCNNGTELSTLSSNVTPEELNLSPGLAGTLVDKIKKNSIDYFKCMSRKCIYPLGASLHYLVPGGIRISYRD
jgi:hypothetical protein